MEALMKIVIEYVSIWAPSLVSVCMVIFAVITAISKITTLLESIKNSTDYNEVKTKLGEVSEENRELVRCNKLLLDQLTKINDYADHKKKEKKDD